MIALSQVFIIILCADTYFEAWRFIPVLSISAVFSSFTAFFGSVYLVKKKSVLTFVTSMTGAIVNIALNLLLIPSMGAQGAAIATCISYLAVFVIRAVNTRKYVRFSLHSVRIVLNVILLSAQTVLLLAFEKHTVFMQIACVLLIISVNAKPFIEAFKYILREINKKFKKN